MAVYVSLAIFFVACDRLLKTLAADHLPGNGFGLVGDFFVFSAHQNRFIAFSLPFSGPFLPAVIILVILAMTAYLVFLYGRGNFAPAVCALFVVLGAAGNLYDRLLYGYVIDYLDLKYFTVFNLSDVMIVGGMAGLAWFAVRKK